MLVGTNEWCKVQLLKSGNENYKLSKVTEAASEMCENATRALRGGTKEIGGHAITRRLVYRKNNLITCQDHHATGNYCSH
jgi:hypothetical protein